MAFGVVAGILQTLCLTKAFGEQDKALENEKFDATWRLYMGGSALASTTAETIGKAFSARAKQGPSRGQVSGAGTFLRVVGRVGGLIAGLGMAVLDLRKAAEVRKEHQQGLSYLYMGAAVSGAALTFAIYISAAIPVIGLLIALLVGIVC